ncbi:unnamed protein product [Microthlaspi erraticum]|uniref:Oxidoreductase FAD/NAD(P)-binding domain-containing protein n=1 Tax=Microthlaspi erraticum TaxID=1685480 RepID=A0A6D2LD92_9BRAS|nr:unnamed protein product [Microthlaspi erraticum]
MYHFFLLQQNNSINFNSKPWSSSLALNQRTTSIGDSKRYTNSTICMSVQQTSSSKVSVSPIELEDPKDPPLHLYKPKEAYTAKIVSVERVVGANAPGETCHIVIYHDGNLPYWEGQSYGVIPPGENPKKPGAPHNVRLYSIASTSVCSNFLCDSKPGDKIQISGPSGKVMLLPEDDPNATHIMIATGTGVAPYRGYLRRMFMENVPNYKFGGLAWLFLGVANTDSLLFSRTMSLAST